MFSTLAAAREIDFVLQTATHLPVDGRLSASLLQALSNRSATR